MPSAICPECETLVGISPTDEALEYREALPLSIRLPVGTARYWLVDLHPDKRGIKLPDGWPICSGSGKRV